MTRTAAALALLCVLGRADVLKMVCASGCDYTSLQTAIDAARDGQATTCREWVLEIPAGATLEGAYTLRNRPTCAKYIRFRSSRWREFTPGVRVARGDARLATLGAPDGHYGSIFLQSSTVAYYAFEGLEIRPHLTGGGSQFSLIQVGDTVTSRADEPHHIVIDHSYLHGNDGQPSPTKGFYANGRQITVRDSIIANIKAAPDASAINIINGSGPLLVRNSEVSGAGQGVFSGGAATGVAAQRGVIPSHITVVGNYMPRPFAWKYTTGAVAPTRACDVGEWYYDTVGTVYYQCTGAEGTWEPGTPPPCYTVKPTLELKNAAHVSIWGNYMENGWTPVARTGCQTQIHAFILLNQVDGNTTPAGRAPWTGIYDVNVRFNRTTGGVMFVHHGYLPSWSAYWRPTSDIRVEHNLVTNLARSRDAVSGNEDGSAFQVNRTSGSVFRHNTIIPDSSSVSLSRTLKFVGSTANTTYDRHSIVRDNIFHLGHYNFVSESGANGQCAANRAAMSGATIDIRKNLFVNPLSKSATLSANVCGGANRFDLSHAIEPTVAGAVNTSTWKVQPTYAGWASDATDPGADIDRVTWATESAESGDENPYLDMKVKSISVTSSSATLRYTGYNSEACTVTTSTAPSFPADLGTNNHRRAGRYGEATVTGLDPATLYYFRLTCAGRYVEASARTAAGL